MSKVLEGDYAVLEKSGDTSFKVEVFNKDKKTVRLFETDDEQLVKSFLDAKKSAATVDLKRYPPAGRGYSTTKVQDNFWLTGRAGPGASPLALWWFMSGDLWERESLDLLEACLARMTYFGRAESITEISLISGTSTGVPEPNCSLHEARGPGMVPVLAPMTDASLEQVQASTDDGAVANATIPPGTRWLFAERPRRPSSTQPTMPILKRKPTQLVQFAIGARVAPALRDAVRMTQRFRGRALKAFLKISTHGALTDWRDAPTDLKERAAFFTGKDGEGQALPGHRHPVFFLHAENERPTRLCVWRSEAFDDVEQAAILTAAEAPLPLGFKGDPWTVTLVPLDSLVAPPPAVSPAAHECWRTVTPFVPPRQGRRLGGRADSSGVGEPGRLLSKRPGVH
ncbi:MAG: hypothetical protein LAQ69_43665 [Acidobacteriia bacterium]|nr:hypothetical protein [Terriglobia bacterium]